jgi:hypothetical protein
MSAGDKQTPAGIPIFPDIRLLNAAKPTPRSLGGVAAVQARLGKGDGRSSALCRESAA